jgi:DNA polymerase IV
MFVPRSDASILHADVDSFFASVAQRDDPALRGRAVIVGEGVVMAASYEAKASGVRSGMGGAEARRVCPEAVIVPSDFAAYSDASRKLFDLFRDTAPVVEALSLEEAFLDVAGLEHVSGSPAWIGASLRRRAREELGLPLSVGVARTRSLAKMASRAAKPDGMVLIEPARELEFLHPLAVEAIWGIGPATAARLHRLGAATVGQMAALGLPTLLAEFGDHTGRHLHALAHSTDSRLVRGQRGRGSFGSQSAFRARNQSRAERDRILSGVVDRVTRRLRSADRAGRTITLRLRYADFERATRSRTVAQPTNSTVAVGNVARELLREAEPTIATRGLTLIGVTVGGLAPRGSGVQLTLDDVGGDLDGAIDRVRDLFGNEIVSRGTASSGDRSPQDTEKSLTSSTPFATKSVDHKR